MKPPDGWAMLLSVLAAIEEREVARAPRTDCCGVRLLPGDWLTRDGCCSRGAAVTTRRSRAADTQPATFGVCSCGHGEHAHELKRDNRTRTHCTLYYCRCKSYDEADRYSLRLVPQSAAGYGDPKPDED